MNDDDDDDDVMRCVALRCDAMRCYAMLYYTRYDVCVYTHTHMREIDYCEINQLYRIPSDKLWM